MTKDIFIQARCMRYIADFAMCDCCPERVRDRAAVWLFVCVSIVKHRWATAEARYRLLRTGYSIRERPHEALWSKIHGDNRKAMGLGVLKVFFAIRCSPFAKSTLFPDHSFVTGVNSVYVPAFTMSRIRCVSIRIIENMCEIMNYYDYDKLQSIFLKQLNFMKRRKKTNWE